jgi:hypothetical protein
MKTVPTPTITVNTEKIKMEPIPDIKGTSGLMIIFESWETPLLAASHHLVVKCNDRGQGKLLQLQ